VVIWIPNPRSPPGLETETAHPVGCSCCKYRTCHVRGVSEDPEGRQEIAASPGLYYRSVYVDCHDETDGKGRGNNGAEFRIFLLLLFL
jgi:hypothetical protein